MRNSGFQTTKKFNKQQIKPGQRLVVPKKPSVGQQKPYLEDIIPDFRFVRGGEGKRKIAGIRRYRKGSPNSYLEKVMAPKERNVFIYSSVSVGKNSRKSTRGRNFKYIPIKLKEETVTKKGVIKGKLRKYKDTIKVPYKQTKKFKIN